MSLYIFVFCSNCLKYIKKKLEQKKNCNLPWELSLYKTLDLSEYQPCETDDQYKAKTLGMDAYTNNFLILNTEENRMCPLPCNQKKWERLQIQRYGRKKNHLTYVKEDLFTYYGLTGGNLEDTSFVLVKYSFGGLIQRNTKSYLVDTVGFISNIGGGLGLALGISIFSFLDYITVNILDRIKAYTSVSGAYPVQNKNQHYGLV